MTQDNSGAFSSEENELVQAFTEGQKELSELPETLQRKMLYGTEGQKPDPVDEATEVVEPAEDADESVEQTAEGQKPDGKKRDKKHGKRTKEETQQVLLDRANKINELVQGQQRHEHKMRTDAQYRADYLKKFGIDVPAATATKPKVDVWSEDFHQTTAQRLAEAEAKLARIEEEKNAHQLFKGLETFARKTAGYAFEASVAELDQAAKALEVKLGKEPTSEELVAIGFEPEDVAMFDRLCKVQKLQFEKKLEDFDTAWYVYERQHGEVKLSVANDDASEDSSGQEVDEKTARRDRMAKVLGHPKVLGSQRAKTADQGLTPEYATRWMDAHGDPDLWTDQDRATHKRIQKMMGIG